MCGQAHTCSVTSRLCLTRRGRDLVCVWGEFSSHLSVRKPSSSVVQADARGVVGDQACLRRRPHCVHGRVDRGQALFRRHGVSAAPPKIKQSPPSASCCLGCTRPQVRPTSYRVFPGLRLPFSPLLGYTVGPLPSCARTVTGGSTKSLGRGGWRQGLWGLGPCAFPLGLWPRGRRGGGQGGAPTREVVLGGVGAGSGPASSGEGAHGLVRSRW